MSENYLLSSETWQKIKPLLDRSLGENGQGGPANNPAPRLVFLHATSTTQGVITYWDDNLGSWTDETLPVNMLDISGNVVVSGQYYVGINTGDSSGVADFKCFGTIVFCDDKGYSYPLDKVKLNNSTLTNSSGSGTYQIDGADYNLTTSPINGGIAGLVIVGDQTLGCGGKTVKACESAYNVSEIDFDPSYGRITIKAGTADAQAMLSTGYPYTDGWCVLQTFNPTSGAGAAYLAMDNSGNLTFTIGTAFGWSNPTSVAIVVGNQTGLSTSIGYMKSDGVTTGTLVFTGGILTDSY